MDDFEKKEYFDNSGCMSIVAAVLIFWGAVAVSLIVLLT